MLFNTNEYMKSSWLLQMYKEGQRILERQRFQFPTSWLYSDNIEGEWGAFNDIMKRKDSSIQTQVASLQMKIVSEDKVVESKTSDLLADWDKDKPVAVSKRGVQSQRTLLERVDLYMYLFMLNRIPDNFMLNRLSLFKSFMMKKKDILKYSDV